MTTSAINVVGVTSRNPVAAGEEPRMDPQLEQDPQDLTAESLIEEVSIDGMCGVY